MSRMTLMAIMTRVIRVIRVTRMRPRPGVLLALLGLPVMAATGASNPAPDNAAAHDPVQLAQSLLQDSDAYWTQEIKSLGSSYELPGVTVFEGSISGVCMAGSPLTGSFYCPSDEHVYLDRDFVRQVARRAGPATDLALAFLIGHEVGQHVQFLVGTTALVEQARANSTAELSARTWATAQLQADCYAGLWVRWALMHAEIGPGESTSAALDAVAAASQALQAHLPAHATMVDPVLTYGTPAQRLKWFQRGEDTGQFKDCDTFGAEAAGKL